MIDDWSVSNCGGTALMSTFYMNPQYSLTVNKSNTTVVIKCVFQQPNNNNSNNIPIGIYVLKKDYNYYSKLPLYIYIYITSILFVILCYFCIDFQ